MNGDTVVLLIFLTFIAILLLGSWMLRKRNKPKGSRALIKLAIAVSLAVVFFVISFVIIFVATWGSARPPHEWSSRNYETFSIVNKSSIPLQVSANMAYTPEELDKLKKEGIDIDPTVNFVSYNVIIPNSDKSYQNSYLFETSILKYSADTEWPSELCIILSDTLGEELTRYYSYNIDSVTRANMKMEITDSLLKSAPKVLIPDDKMWRKGGDE